MSRFGPIALILIAMISIQGGASLAKSLFPVLGASGATTLRLAFAALILVGVWRPWRRRLPKADLHLIILYGLALGAMNLTFYYSLERLPLGLAVALEFTGPLSIALFSSRRPIDFVWAVLAITGVVLLLPGVTTLDSAVDPVGVAFALAAGCAWAVYIVIGKKAGARAESGLVTSIGMVAAFTVAVPFGVAHAGATLVDPRILPVALAVAVFSSALPYSLEMVALKSMPARNFGILMSLEPAVAALIGWIVLGEKLDGTQWLAIACVMSASFGSAFGQRSAQVVAN